MTDEQHQTLEKYLKEKLCGEYIDIDQETERHRQRFRELAGQGDGFASSIMKVDDVIQSLPVQLRLAEHFGLNGARFETEQEVDGHIKDYYKGVGFEFVGYRDGFADFRKESAYLSVNLTTVPFAGLILVSVHDKSGNCLEVD